MWGRCLCFRKIGLIGIQIIAAVAVLIACMALDGRIDANSGDRGGPRPNGRTEGPWCMAAHNRNGSRDCGYSTFDQCFAAAGRIGGTCRPNLVAFPITDDAPYRTYRAIYPDSQY